MEGSERPKRAARGGARKQTHFTLNVDVVPATDPPRETPELVAFAFDATDGRLLGDAPVAEGAARFDLPAETHGRAVRFVVAPKDAVHEPTLRTLRRVGYERRLIVDLERPEIGITVHPPIHWFLCQVVVRGRVVKPVMLPDGTVRELPICRSRVTICEVDRFPNIVHRIPDDILQRLRDELVKVVVRPKIPRFPPPPPPPPFPGPTPDPPPFRLFETALSASSPHGMDTSLESNLAHAGGEHVALRALASDDRLSEARESLDAAPSAARALAEAPVRTEILTLAALPPGPVLRQGIAELVASIRPLFCLWPWLWPFWRYSVDCLTTVETDESGHFETVLWVPCFGDQPDLYFSVEQLQGATWKTIYEPPVPCATRWDYVSGTDVVISITDPSAIPCVPPDPIHPPAGVDAWAMPWAVGGTVIGGTPPGSPTTPTGWVRPDGLTNYASFVDAPFAGTLGFRLGYRLPASIPFYRFSYRKGSSGSWTNMDVPVDRHYVKQSPGHIPTFPVHSLGPQTVGTTANLYEFRRPMPPPPAPGDPPGTTTAWPVDDWFGDIYSAFLHSMGLPPNVGAAAGQYQIRIELFDGAGNSVAPGAGTFSWIVPIPSAPAEQEARPAQPGELDGNAFVFNLHIDNNPCSASIDVPTTPAAAADACGFLRYDPASDPAVTLGFHAVHPNNRAVFDFTLTLGATGVGAASASGEVGAASAGAYAGDGAGNFQHAFTPSAALRGTCDSAAFAMHLHVQAKATNGSSRWSYFDRAALQAFALAPEESP